MKRRISFESISVSVLLLLGFALRLRQYLTLRSLWADEAMLALNIVHRDFAGLLQPLELNQGAPIGFLMIEKLFNTILGRHELVLRFFPFLAGVAALGLFYLLIRNITSTAGLSVALALFAFNPQLIYYTSESKQYIVDVFVLLGMLVCALPLFQSTARKTDHLRLTLAGILAMWLSHPALFILAGIGTALFVQSIQKQETATLRPLIVTGILWLANFALLYFVNLRHLSGNSYLTDYWVNEFLPMPPWSDPGWFAAYIHDSVTLQLGIQFAPWLAAVLILAGWIVVYREARPVALTFAFITFFAFSASALQLYPVKGRLALFMVPLGIILLGKAVEFVQRTFSFNKMTAVIVPLAFSGWLLFNPIVESAQNFITPKYFEHMRPYMDYLSASWRDGDELFVSFWAEPAFQYYVPFYELENVRYTTSEYDDYPDPQALQARFDPLIGEKRVWVLFSHVYQQGDFNERDLVLAHLDSLGEKRRELRLPDTSVYLYLYDLSQ